MQFALSVIDGIPKKYRSSSHELLTKYLAANEIRNKYVLYQKSLQIDTFAAPSVARSKRLTNKEGFPQQIGDNKF